MTLKEFLQQLSEHCGMEIGDENMIEIEEDDEFVRVQLNFPEEESGRFIGFRGDGLAAIQRVARIVFEKQYEGKKIVLNINDYKQRREEQLREKVVSIALKVVQTGRPFTFQHYIPSHERYFIHSILNEIPEAKDLESISSGDGMQRRLTIRVKI